jgi:hypothetical protein
MIKIEQSPSKGVIPENLPMPFDWGEWCALTPVEPVKVKTNNPYYKIKVDETLEIEYVDQSQASTIYTRVKWLIKRYGYEVTQWRKDGKYYIKRLK